MWLKYSLLFACAFAGTCSTFNRIQCGQGQRPDWEESDCLQAGCCWNNNVNEIAYRCTKNDQDAQRSLEARTTNTNYTDILTEVIAYHDSRAVWAVPFYTTIPFVIIAAFNWIKNIYQD